MCCAYFQLHGKEGVVAEIEPEIDGKAKAPLISAPEALGAIRIPLPEYTGEGHTNYHFRQGGQSAGGESSQYYHSHPETVTSGEIPALDESVEDRDMETELLRVRTMLMAAYITDIESKATAWSTLAKELINDRTGVGGADTKTLRYREHYKQIKKDYDDRRAKFAEEMEGLWDKVDMGA